MTNTSTNTLALPYLQPYRAVTALAMAYLAMVSAMCENGNGERKRSQQSVVERTA